MTTTTMTASHTLQEEILHTLMEEASHTQTEEALHTLTEETSTRTERGAHKMILKIKVHGILVKKVRKVECMGQVACLEMVVLAKVVKVLLVE